MRRQSKPNTTIIDSFLQLKNGKTSHKKNRKTDHKLELSRTIGERVLRANSITANGKVLKDLKPSLDKHDIDTGFLKTIGKTIEKRQKIRLIGILLVTNKPYAILSFFLNGVILNSAIINLFMIIFFISNLLYYSLAVWLNYFYNPLIVLLLLVVAYLLSAIISIVKMLKQRL